MFLEDYIWERTEKMDHKSYIVWLDGGYKLTYLALYFKMSRFPTIMFEKDNLRLTKEGKKC